jgi:RNA polymerase sigma-70 factor (TIGR02960 family)
MAGLPAALIKTRGRAETNRPISCKHESVPDVLLERDQAEALLHRARAGDEHAFAELTRPYRRELQVHCYRMLGSLQDAEDLLQETLLAAWRGLARFEGRSSLRAWLYRIATNRCLNALRDRGPRPPSPEPPFPPPEPTSWGDPGWLEPYPDALLAGVADTAPGPGARYETREAIELSFITGLQRLPPRQRAALVLRDVLGFHADEAAQMLGSSEASLKSALQRARATLSGRDRTRSWEQVPAPRSRHERTAVKKFADAFLAADLDGLLAVLTDDALLTMPPAPHEYQGLAAIAAFQQASFAYRARRRAWLLPVRANTQPAFGAYLEDPGTGAAPAAGLIVLAVSGEKIKAITRFHDDHLLPLFGLPLVHAPELTEASGSLAEGE